MKGFEIMQIAVSTWMLPCKCCLSVVIQGVIYEFEDFRLTNYEYPVLLLNSDFVNMQRDVKSLLCLLGFHFSDILVSLQIAICFYKLPQ